METSKIDSLLSALDAIKTHLLSLKGGPRAPRGTVAEKAWQRLHKGLERCTRLPIPGSDEFSGVGTLSKEGAVLIIAHGMEKPEGRDTRRQHAARLVDKFVEDGLCYWDTEEDGRVFLRLKESAEE